MAFIAEHPQNIPAGYHKPIGQIVVRWGFTELYLQSIIWHIWEIKDPKVARLLTWDLGAASKVELFKLLAPRWLQDANDRHELGAIASEANRLREIRNRLAHAIWGYKPGQPKRLMLMHAHRQTRILPRAKFISTSDVKKWAAELNALNLRLKRFHRHLGAPTP